jgi:hypothetical protein
MFDGRAFADHDDAVIFGQIVERRDKTAQRVFIADVALIKDDPVIGRTLAQRG